MTGFSASAYGAALRDGLLQVTPSALARINASGPEPVALPGVMLVPPTITVTQTNSSTIPTFVTNLPNSSKFLVTGTPQSAWSTDAQYQVSTNGSGGQTIGNFVTYEFASDANLLEFKLVNFNSQFSIWVDGQLIQNDGFVFNSSGSRMFVKLDWTADAYPRKRRTYRISGINLPFGGIYTDQYGSVWYPSDLDRRFFAVFFGDSYTQGTGSVSPDRVYGAMASQMFGWRYWADGIGGTGFNSASPNDPVSRIGRGIAKLTARPDVIFVPFGFNDASAILVGNNQANLVASYNAMVDTLRAAWPGVPIVSVGPWTPQGGSSTLTVVKNLIVGAASAKSVKFRDIENFVNSVNKAIYTADDLTHPRNTSNDNAGSNFLALRMAPLLGLVDS